MQITSAPTVFSPEIQSVGSRIAASLSPATFVSNRPTGQDAVTTFDFTSMTPREMQATMNDLIKSGKMSLDESMPLMLKVGQYLSPLSVNNSRGPDLSNQPMDFIEALRIDMKNMEETGYAKRSDSGFQYWQAALDKLKGLQGSVAGLNAVA